MESKITIYKKVTLILDDLEANWLKGVMQNELYGSETETDRTMRQIFWDALHHNTPHECEFVQAFTKKEAE